MISFVFLKNHLTSGFKMDGREKALAGRLLQWSRREQMVA